MSTALKISDNHFIVLNHVQEVCIKSDKKIIHLIIDQNREDILISIQEFGEGEYHRIKREIEEFFNIDL
jgi:hypothetical protein